MVAPDALWVDAERRRLCFIDARSEVKFVDLDTLWLTAERINGLWLALPWGPTGLVLFGLTAVADAADLHVRDQ